LQVPALPGRAGGSRVNATHTEAEAPASKATMRASATWFLDQQSLPSHGTIVAFENDFRDFLEQLIQQIDQLTEESPNDAAQARVASARVREARHRLGLAERPGLVGEFERVKGLARSVVVLCEHHDALTDMAMSAPRA
jgi:hypothetical protein